ncbi:unnamed protein product, partial [Lepidochelys olivacea]
GDRFQCLPHPAVLHSLLLSNGAWDPCGHGFGSLRGHLPSPETFHHPGKPHRGQDRTGSGTVWRYARIALPLPGEEVPYSRTNIIPHTYCEHMAVVKLACGDVRVSSYYGLSVAFLVTGLDGFFIALSYIEILRAIFSLPTNDARLKTFETCGSHLCVILVSYIPPLFSLVTHRFGHNVPLNFHALIAN